MAANNYFGFTHGGTQYGTATAGAAYAGGQTGYAVAPAATAASYGTQRAAAAGYDTAYQAAATQGTYAAAGAQAGTYQLAYGRTAAAAAQQSYDASKTAYYQQAAAAAAAYPQQQQPAYEAAAQPKPAYTTTPNYAQTGAARGAQPAKATQYGGSYGTGSTAVAAYPAAQTYATPPAPAQHSTPPAKQAAAASSTTYSGYDAALYSAATMYVAQQNKGGGGNSGGTGWQGYKKGGTGGGARMRPKQSPKPQQLHYCDVCRISCAGPQTYREHLEGQKHKKKEASMKVSAGTAAASAGGSSGSGGGGGRGTGGSLRCELCDVTCTGGDAYAAHVRGIKHQKVVKLHTRLGKPIPSQEPKVVGGDKNTTASGTTKIKFVSSGGLSTVSGTHTGTTSEGTAAEGESAGGDEAGESEPDIQPVGQDYIEEMKGDDGKVLSFNCKLCDCRFNDPNAKEMHMKGRRHRLQYKKKVQPDLVVDVKPSLRQRKLPGQKMQRMLDELWARRRMHKCEMEEEERVYWEERRRFNEECDYLEWCRRSGPPVPPQGHGMQHRGHAMSPPFLPPFANHLSHPSHPSHPPMPHFMPPPGRRPESSDDRHVIASHSEIYPGEEELQSIQRVVSHTERALKSVSDTLTEQALKQQPKKGAPAKQDKPADKVNPPANGDKKEEVDKDVPKEDGRDNQLFSFLQEGELAGNSGAVRLLKGVMRVGLLAKGLLLKGDRNVRLVVLCADKPTVSLLKRVAQELPIHFLKVTDEFKYKVELCPAEGAVSITDGNISVLISLTSPVMREPNDVGGGADAPKRDEKDVLPKQKCLQALASLRHAKWFQARVSGLQSVVMVIRIMRDLCRRIPTWTPLNSWAMELMVEKVSSSAGVPLSPGECFRRVMEAVAGGLLLEYGPGLLDPCEKDHNDALGNLPPQKREDLTASAQQILRQIAFKQIHKVLDMEPLPPPWFSRKRRRSNTETEGDGKMVKTDGQEKMDTSEGTAGGD